jgi:hypothetical protein
MPLNIRHKPMALFPLLRKSYCGFVSAFEIHLLAEFEPAILVSNGKHANHYTTEKVQVLEMGNNLKLPVHIHMTCLGQFLLQPFVWFCNREEVFYDNCICIPRVARYN